jgi:mannose-1-phosphate guanylyltransferase
MAREQLPELPAGNFIIEPVGRDTSACLGMSALHLERRASDAIMLALPADHHIADAAAYRALLEKGVDNLAGATGVVFGIVPLRPDIGYGYVQAQQPASPADAWPVLRFVEKPDAETALRYMQAGNFFWNSGMFLWRNQTLLELFARHMPDTYRGLERLRGLLSEAEPDADEICRVFSGLQRISVDFGILEKCSGLRLLPAAFGWDDIGNWASLERVLQADGCSNIAVGRHAAVESRGCIVYSDTGMVATFGVSDLIVVQAHGKVLVCAKERAAELKRLVSSLGSELV